jgi:hypothetical protein
MTAKEYVKSKMPNARAERHVEGQIIGKPYWLIRDGRNTMYFASGKTESNAWVEAKKRLIEQQAMMKIGENVKYPSGCTITLGKKENPVEKILEIALDGDVKHTRYYTLTKEAGLGNDDRFFEGELLSDGSYIRPLKKAKLWAKENGYTKLIVVSIKKRTKPDKEYNL